MSYSNNENTPAFSGTPESEEEIASSPAPKPAHGAAGASSEGPKVWSKEDANTLLSLFFRSLFFILPRVELSQSVTECCKKVIIQNLIEKVLIGVDLSLYKAGGYWGKALNKVVKERKVLQPARGTSGTDLSPDSQSRQSGSPDSNPSVRGLDGVIIPPPSSGPRAVSGHKGSDLNSHSRQHFKANNKLRGGKGSLKNHPSESQEQKQLPIVDTKPSRKPEWFEIDGVMYRRDIKLNPDFLSKGADGEMMVHVPFLAFSDARCDDSTRALAEMLGVTDVRKWTFKLSALEAEPVGWSQPNPKADAAGGLLSSRAAKLLKDGRQLPRFNLEPEPTCIVDAADEDWFLIFVSKPGGFGAVTDLTFKADPAPGAECVIIKPTKGVTGPDYIVNEYFGTSPNKVLMKRRFSQLECASQVPFDGWADIRVPLPERSLDFNRVQKKRIKNGMIVLMIKKLAPPPKEAKLIEL